VLLEDVVCTWATLYFPSKPQEEGGTSAGLCLLPACGSPEQWGSFERWDLTGITGCEWVKALKQLGDAGPLEGVCG